MDTKLYAYYFPNWHVDEQNERFHGQGWTEWQVMKYATPRFEGHLQPKHPLWGCEDESDSRVMEKKIETAVNYKIEGFIFDWYWFENGSYRINCIDNGFLKAKNCEDIKFAVMWCNHTAIQAHPTSKYDKNKPTIICDNSEKTFFDLTEYCIKNYFHRPNYITIEGKPYFCIYSLPDLINKLGVDAVAKMFADFRERVKKAGIEDVHINICDTFYVLPDKSSLNEILEKIGADSVTPHGWQKAGLDFPKAEYSDFVELSMKRMEESQKFLKFPFFPTVAPGWDSSPRTVQSEIYGDYGYPFCPIVVNNTPELFAEALKSAKALSDTVEQKDKFITIASLNEWTEGMYLEPDEENGFAMLEKVREVKESW